MSSLFDKIGTLVNAQVNDLLGKNPRSPLARIRLDAEGAEKEPRRAARSLRQRLDEASEYEDQLQVKIDGLMREALEMDAAVDASLQRGDQFGARRLQGQLNMKRQQIAIAESELRDHRRVTRHLAQEMRDLESALDSRHSKLDEGRRESRTRIPLDKAGPVDAIVDGVTEKLNEAREGIETLFTGAPTEDKRRSGGKRERIVIVDEAPDPRQPKPLQSDRKKMNRRLTRLSKPDGDDS